MTRPFLKWAGGKTQLLPIFRTLYPKVIPSGRYIEPFMGSGAVFFHVQQTLAPRQAFLADNNPDLVNVFHVVRDRLDTLGTHLARHQKNHSKEYFYKVRDDVTGHESPVAQAARLIYLNKTCFNGLYRVNSRGQFNVPIGSYKNPRIFNQDVLAAASACLQNVDVATRHFRRTLEIAVKGDFVYFDPPYDPVSKTASFTSYTEGVFGHEAQVELADVFRQLAARGCQVMLSNSYTPLIRKLYARKLHANLNMKVVSARRNINATATSRGPVREVVVRNY